MKEHPQAWKLNRENQQEPQAAMVKYHKWLKKHGSIAFASWPVTYDFMFLYWYLMKFVGSSPFLYSGPDIKTYAMAMQKFPSWTEFGEHCVPDEWKAINQAQIDKYCPPELQIEHTPLLDCIKEGFQFCNMLIKNLDEKEKES